VTIVLLIFLLAVLGYGAIMLRVYLTQSSRIYIPSRTMVTTPGYFGYRYEIAVFQTTDGITLHGWFMPHEQTQRVVLFCHGNRGNISEYMETIAIFQRMGMAIFVFDYRGYGLSEGQPDEEGTYRDAAAAWSYLVNRRGLNPADIIIMGRSLGAAIASDLATRNTPRALVLESTFTSLPTAAAELHPLLPVSLMSRYRYPVLENVKKVTCPVLVIHSPEDEVILFPHAEKLYAAAAEPKEFLTITGNHFQGYLASGSLYTDSLNEFLHR